MESEKLGKGVTIIGKTARINGEIIGNEELTIEGYVEGKISLESKVYVEQGGQVNADITSHSITVAGSIKGNVVVTDRAEILQGGTLVGDIKAPRLVINDGARILGRIEMDVSDKGGDAVSSPLRFEAPSNPTLLRPKFAPVSTLSESADEVDQDEKEDDKGLNDFLRNDS